MDVLLLCVALLPDSQQCQGAVQDEVLASRGWCSGALR